MRYAWLIVVALALTACGTAPKKPPPSAKYYLDDGPPDRVPDNLAAIPDAIARDEPFHRYANRPYTVFGQTYVPVVNKETFRQRGYASWYGKKFHGHKTASGETYDMFAMTAAHPTLPIPSYARVTNLRTGESVVVRINDRGPFHSSRIIDLSYAAAARIGVALPGSAMVEVERVFAGTPPAPVAEASVTPPTVETPVLVEDQAGVWLQLGAFATREAAENFRDKVTSELDWYREPIQIASRDGLQRVRLGPCRNRDEAAAISAKVAQTLGFTPTISAR